MSLSAGTGLVAILELGLELLASDQPQGTKIDVKEQSEKCASARSDLVVDIIYHNLDEKGRTTGAEACIKRITYEPDETARTTPVGWKTGMDRTHLIGRQFGGSNTDRRNIIPMYPWANRTGMAAIEDEVARRVTNGETVYLAVIPVWRKDTIDDELVPTGVNMFISSESGSYGVNIPNE